jgi:outer membrane lipoprotein-sorting protein
MNTKQGCHIRKMLLFGALLLAVPVTTTTVSARQARPQQPALSVPAVPSTGGAQFLDQVAGRAAVADSFYALSKSSLSVSAKWRILTEDERKRVSARAGGESLVVNPQANRVNLVSTILPAPNTPDTVARFVSDGNVLLGTRFVAALPPKKGAAPSTPTRTYFRIPIEGDISTATEALILAKATDAPLTRVARAALLSPLENGGYGWRGRGTFARNADGSVTETLPTEGNERRSVTTTRRYRFNKSRLPVSIEEWVTNTNRERNVTRTVYRQETYTYSPFPTRTDVFTTKPAANYAETSPPSGVTLPEPPGPDEADAKARALLLRWERAWARMSAYKARVAVSSQTLAQTPESRPIPPREATQEGSFTLYYNRPGRLYVATEPNPKAGKDTQGMDRRRVTLAAPQTAVSDGKTLGVYEGTRRRGDTPVNGDDNQLRPALRRNGFDDRAEALTWIFDGPQTLFGNAEFAEYRGTLPSPGGAAEVVTIRQTFTQNGARRQRQRGGGRGGRGGTTVETTVYNTIYFDSATGLPLRIERYISTDVASASLRDDPPNRYFSADYSAVRVNEESSPGIFQLP